MAGVRMTAALVGALLVALSKTDVAAWTPSPMTTAGSGLGRSSMYYRGVVTTGRLWATVEKPTTASTGSSSPSLTDTAALSDVMAREHEETLRLIAAARAEAQSEYAARIEALEAEVLALRKGGLDQVFPKMTPAPAPISEKIAAPRQELNYLEFAEVPSNVIAQKTPMSSTVRSVARAVGPDAPGEICHVILDTAGKLPYVEGQSIAVLPPGVDMNTGKPHRPRLYSIASSRYGDDGAGTSVSLCVRRAVYKDPETGLEDPLKKGVCSNFLCDSKEGDVVPISGPVGKTMLLPEDDPEADLIMVATGTGVAPFRGFVQRLFVERTPAAAAFSGQAWLFLGVPTSSSILYPQLWEEAKANANGQDGAFRLTLAVSREMTNPFAGETNSPDSGTESSSRCYVQHKLREHADDVFKRLENGAHIYFCGLKGMMPGIEDALERACHERSLDFHAWLKTLKKEKRWHVEVY